MSESIITLLCLTAYKAYLLSLVPHSQSAKVFSDFSKACTPGALVMEVSTIYVRANDPIRIGHLERVTEEPFYTPEQWAELGEKDEPVPLERVWYIKALVSGDTKRWTNADFIRVIGSIGDPWRI